MGRKRYYYLALGCLSLFLLSVIYSWSIFIAPLEEEFGFSRSAISSVFTVSMCMFGLGGMAGGLISKYLPSKIIFSIALVLCVLAYPISACSNTLIVLYLGYGVLGGVGSGIGYNALLGLLAKWFPDRPGICNGVLLMGYAFGSSLISPLCSSIIEASGWRCAMLSLGICAACALTVALVFIKPPASDASKQSVYRTSEINEQSVDTKRMLTLPEFWCLLLWSTLLSGAGMAVISNASPIALQSGITERGAIAIVSSLIALGNGFGRLCFGRAADRFGIGTVMLAVNLGLPASLLAVCAAVYLRSGAFLFAGCCCVGFFYGGVPLCQTIATRGLFGDEYYTANIAVGGLYGILASFIGPLIAGASYDRSGSYLSALLIFICLGLTILLPLRRITLFLKRMRGTSPGKP